MQRLIRSETLLQTPPSDAVQDQVFAALDARLTTHDPAPLAVALSGGGDSIALLGLAALWAKARGRRLVAFTVDHGLHPQSGQWTRAAGESAQRLGVDWRALHWLGVKPTGGVSAAARGARHALIAEAARAVGARVALMGHTRDDLEEAVAMRAAGSSVGAPQAWAPSPAWPEGRDLFILRPLLAVSRLALREWLGPEASFIEDPANDDPASLRTRVRRELERDAERPPVHLDYGSRWTSALAALAAHVDIDDAGALRLEAGRLAPPAGDALLARAILCASGGSRPPRPGAIARLMGRAHAGAPFTATLAGARIEARSSSLLVVREAGERSRGGLASVPIRAGATLVWDGRFEITTAQSGLVGPVQGARAGLKPADLARLKALPAAARPGLPLFRAETGGGPALATCDFRVRCLVGARFRAACGVIAHEGEIDVRSRGEGSIAPLS